MDTRLGYCFEGKEVEGVGWRLLRYIDNRRTGGLSKSV